MTWLRRFVYWARFMRYGISVLCFGGVFTFREAWQAIANEYECRPFPGDLSTPEHDCAEALSYWGDGV